MMTSKKCIQIKNGGDMMAKARYLSDDDVENIRKLYKEGTPIEKLRKKYRVAHVRIRNILKNNYVHTPKGEKAGRPFVMTFEEKITKTLLKIRHAKKIYESINVGDYLELIHYDDAEYSSKDSKYRHINVHKGQVISKTDKVITVQEAPHKKQGITLGQILSANVKIKNIIKTEKVG
jgi:hypothetical protein